MQKQVYADKLLAKVVKDVSSLGYEFKGDINMEVQWLNAVRTYGQCHFSSSKKEITISLSKYLINGDEKDILNTLYHEVCHAVKGTVGHGTEWKRVAAHVGREFGHTITRTSSKDMFNDSGEEINHKTESKYVLVCNKCQKEVQHYQRLTKAVKTPHLYSHRGCGGRLSSYTKDGLLIAGDGAY